MYPLIRQMLFCFPPEEAHYLSMNLLRAGCSIGPVRSLIHNGFSFKGNSLQKEVFGLPFANPVGLGAGFDKNAVYLRELEALGFGFVEIGTVTPKAQPGNDKPRLFRLPADKALINRMGFNNEGLTTIQQRLAKWNNAQPQTPNPKLIIGGNIGKNKITPNEDAWKDYSVCFDGLFNEVDYFVVNVSSPNTPGLRELQEKDSLKKILSQLQNQNQGKNKPKPLLLKIAPDLTKEQLDDIVALSFEVQLSGLVATNTTISRAQLQTPNPKLQTIGAGGLSGRPVRERATEVVQYLSKQTQNKIPIIASGGIFTGADAREKLDAGASLVQVWTGFIYEGPCIVKNICQYLAANP
ncbi:MAG: quinone-dependent dihydroorotate dehydrogenase [Chitinophagaceae bacterium]|nr:quinone-dependent dihydroorotate dehydrogenase [Chitinophagaceae bacterium]MCA6453778.1 quinone-dependent dihydroorotate dehydrogenase [Chitinophagaceae bacterium]MCA6455301.1 quinone-dependent dihydroorotate dehydrogenase [Chitinophagaceae bacterium]MCA6460110.1 quinone-dependent dihydroorotate dehydrogenase [Chitinophagaceae bacterium]MCA6464066.1 quinone-dependent dihydroorotate dehydrogenase [Chitinophagaceae bacterium]